MDIIENSETKEWWNSLREKLYRNLRGIYSNSGHLNWGVVQRWKKKLWKLVKCELIAIIGIV